MLALRADVRRWIAIYSISLIFLVLLVQNPTTVFTGNLKEFSLNTHDYFPLLLLVYVLAVAIFSLPILLMRGRMLAIIANVLLLLAVIVWAYSNIVVIDFGKLDGELFKFDLVKQFWLLECLVFVGLSVLLFYLYRNHSQPLVYFLMALNILVGSTAILQLATNFISGREFTENGARSIYRLSETKNTLIVVMDQFQSDIFADLVRDNPDIRSELQGFTFFPDTLGVAPTTRLTMPSIHSGVIYESGPTLENFYKKYVEDGSFLNSLSDSGHEVVLISPEMLGCPNNADLCMGVWPAMFSYYGLLYREIEKLLNYSLFRAAPLLLKESFYNDGRWFLSIKTLRGQHFVVIGNMFLERFASLMEIEGQSPATKFIHLMNTHRPYVINERCQYTAENHSNQRRNGMLTQARCALYAFLSVLRGLKEIGAYDNTAIILIADTGVGAFNVGSSHGSANGGPDYVGSGLFAAANPVFLVKPMLAQGDFNTSYKSVQLTDVAATVCDLVGDCDGFPGVSVFRQENADRDRIYNFYYLTQDWDKKDFVPNPVPYTVKGPLWELASWPTTIQPRLRSGSIIELTHDAHNAVYLGEGWGPVTSLGTNSYAAEAVMYFQLSEELADSYEFVVVAEATFSEQGVNGQIVDVYANGQLIESWDFPVARRIDQNRALIAKDILTRNNILEIRFKIKSPNSWVVKRGSVRHFRVRGIRLRSVQFNRIQS